MTTYQLDIKKNTLLTSFKIKINLNNQKIRFQMIVPRFIKFSTKGTQRVGQLVYEPYNI